MTSIAERYDHVIVGGGLAGGLLALALARAGRGAGVALIEAEVSLGGNHTWSYHETDLTPLEHALLRPLVNVRWPTHRVSFPSYGRGLRGGYASVTSAGFAAALAPLLAAAGVRVHLGRRAGVPADVPGTVWLDDGRSLEGALIVDARGADGAAGARGFQKFVGIEVDLDADGPWTEPLLMDATVEQRDGFRFVYVLPFTGRRVLVEDTVYSLDPRLDVRAGRTRALEYLSSRGAKVGRVVREEVGVLPLPLREPESRRDDGAARLSIGYRGGFFHPVTGYSLPLAARVALAIANADTPAAACAAVRRIRTELRPQRRFGMMLNRLLFEAMHPARRWTALARFYRLPEPVIARFYASQTTRWDRTRLFLGRPPAGISWKHLLLAPRRHPSRQEASA